jgi:hypothetical protein
LLHFGTSLRLIIKEAVKLEKMNPLLVLELLTALINEKLQPLRKDIMKNNVWKALLEKAKSFNQLQPWQ